MKRADSHLLLRRALACLSEYPPFALGRSKLAALRYPDRSVLERGIEMQILLLDAIDQLRPLGDENKEDAAWLRYQSLSCEYAKGMNRSDVQDLLALSASTYTRTKSKAFENLTLILEQQHVGITDNSCKCYRSASKTTSQR